MICYTCIHICTFYNESKKLNNVCKNNLSIKSKTLSHFQFKCVAFNYLKPINLSINYLGLFETKCCPSIPYDEYLVTSFPWPDGGHRGPQAWPPPRAKPGGGTLASA